MQSGEDTLAENCFREAVLIAPDFAEGHANLGLLLDRRNRDESAEFHYRCSIGLNPTCAQSHLNLGALLARLKRFDEAEAAYRRAIALSPRSAVGWSNLGVLYAGMKREEQAERCYRTALSLDERYATARFNLSYLLLRQGRFDEGWRCFEARNGNAALAARLDCPRWRGETLQGRSLLIGCEAGQGDMIQFCRYAAELKARGAARIAMLCHPALKTLFATLDAVDSVIALDEPMPQSAWDFWTPLLSVPYYVKTRLDSIPATIPYLRAAPERIAKWRPLLPEAALRVGLVWKGNPRFENDADRSLPTLGVLAPLGSVAGVRYVSLQKGAGEQEAARPRRGLPLIELGSRLQDFADTAAVVNELDLIISVDTAVAHLAGALGKPCWLMLPAYKTDWRWLEDRADSPWYPATLRLFRQASMGDWSGVVAAMAHALKRLAAERAESQLAR